MGKKVKLWDLSNQEKRVIGENVEYLESKENKELRRKRANKE